MDTSSLIADLRELIADEVFCHGGSHMNEKPMNLLLEAIGQKFLTNYEEQRSNVSNLIAIYEDYIDHTLPILLTRLMNGMEKLKTLSIKKLDLKLWEGDWDNKSTFEEYVSFLKANIERGQHLRPSEVQPLQIEPEKAGIYLGVVNRLITKIAIQKTFDSDDANAAGMQIWMARRLAIAAGRKEIFYLLINIFFDGLNFRQHYQFARDLSEECLVCAYQDGMPEYGYFLSFRVFADSSNSVTALHYANVAFSAFQTKGIVVDYVLKNIYWVGVKFCRNIKMTPFAAQLFERRPTNVHYDSHEEYKLYHAYFSSLFFDKDKNLPELVLSFIEKGKEVIIEGGPYEVLPWLALLMNVKRIYGPHEYDERQMDYYMDLFKQIAGQDSWINLHNTLFGSLTDTQELLKIALTKLSHSRNPSDFVTDNKDALLISHRNLAESFKEEDVEAYMLSMILQSDFSTVFRKKNVSGIQPVNNVVELRPFDEMYISPKQIVDFVASLRNTSVLWLGADDRNIYPLFYDGKTYWFLKDTGYNLAYVRQFCQTTLKDMPHNDKLPGNFPMDKEFNDYASEENDLKKLVSFFDFPIHISKPLLIVKDIELSSFPHNLLTTTQGFIVQSVPVSNIASLEWLIQNQKQGLSRPFSSAIWIPTESQDMAICLMHSKIEEVLERHQIVQQQSIMPTEPLNELINIVVAHGDERISTFSAFYLSNSSVRFSIRNFDYIIGDGQILVLFVCHSGSQTSDFLRNQVSTAIKQFLQSGYSAVIAPFWALHINIPPIWLPEFLEALKSGEDVGTATFLANRKVALIYNTPKAYSCLHLYGNPYVKVSP